MARDYRDGNTSIPLVVIPAKAEIQETKPGGRMTAGFYRNRIAWPSCAGHSRKAGMAGLNHWIPAFAGMTAEGGPDPGGRLRASSAAYSRPACLLQAGGRQAGMTTKGILDSGGMTQRLSGWQETLFTPPSSFMDRKSCMRREGRRPVAAQRRLESRKRRREGA